MKRIVSLVLFIACSTLIALAQAAASREGPRISLYLPRGFPSETVQIRYFLTGPFGGYGSFIRSQPDRQTLDFVAAVDGKPADNIKVIAYLPGCEFVKLEFVPAGTADWRQLDCKPLKSITLRGQILDPSLLQGKTATVGLTYNANWALSFFGIFDGMVPTVALSSVVPSANGEFTVNVPDFQSQTNLGQAGYAFVLREVKTGNILASLLPANAPHVYNALDVNQSYPAVIQFAAAPN